MPEQVANSLSQNLDIPLTKNLEKYLGFKLKHHGSNKNSHSELLEKIRSKLTGWGSKCLSRTRRITLARSVLSAMPMFQNQLERLPSYVHNELDKLCRSCIWGGRAHNRKIHMINWQSICKPKATGGLGSRRVFDINKALLSKVNWRMIKEK